MHADDLAHLAAHVRIAARVCPNGEVEWPLVLAKAVVDNLAAAGQVILGLDLRDYDPDGHFIEVAWSAFEPERHSEHAQTVEFARVAAIRALASIVQAV
jgi:hypothetical protein